MLRKFCFSKRPHYTHLLALNYITYFDLKMTTLGGIGAVHHLKELREVLLVSYGYKQCQDHLLLLCNKVLQLLMMGDSKKSRQVILLELLDANNNDDDEKATLLNLMAVFAKKVEAYSSATEQSYVQLDRKKTSICWILDKVIMRDEDHFTCYSISISLLAMLSFYNFID
ncbi:hypothetical protein BD560DRAFT_191925 [Blakeslea trispora]|nr:hypothetical protein BD560DRAFT_191925 [Blakeslea trispora]